MALVCTILTACVVPRDLPTPIATLTPSLTPTLTLPASPTPTITPTNTPTLTPTATPSPAPTPTATATATLTPSPAPTLVLNAITADTGAQVRYVLVIDQHRGAVRGVDISPDGRLIATASTDLLVRLFDSQSGDLLFTLEHHRDTVYSVAFSPDGTRLVSGGRDRTVQIWDPLTGERITGSRTGGEVAQLAFSPDGTRFAGVGYFSAIGEAWQLLDGASLFGIEGHHTRLRSVDWSPDDRWIATGDVNGLVILHDGQTGQPVQTIGPVIGEATAVAFSPAGDMLAVGTTRGVIALWKLDDLSLDASWAGHNGPVLDIAYSPDGSVLITAGEDGAIRLWNALHLSGVRSGSAAYQYRFASLGVHGAPVRAVAISRDGGTLVSGGDDGRVFVWRVVGEE